MGISYHLELVPGHRNFLIGDEYSFILCKVNTYNVLGTVLRPGNSSVTKRNIFKWKEIDLNI